MKAPLAFAATLFVASTGLAYEVEGPVWAGGRATFRVNPNFPDVAAGDAAAQVRAIVAASMAWTLDGGAAFAFACDGTTDRASIDPDDGVNTVFHANQASPEGALAVTFYSYTRSTGRMRGFDVVFFDRSDDRDFTWSTATPPRTSNWDVQDTATHELGHALGLAHSSAAGATMSPTAAPGVTSARSLAADDRAGIVALYGAAPPPPPAVDSVEPPRAALAGGDVLIVRGSGFPSSPPPTVTIGGVDVVDVRVREFDAIVVVAPPGGALGPADVVVRTAGGDALAPGALVYESNAPSLSVTGSPRLGSRIVLEVRGDAHAPWALLADLAAGSTTWRGVTLGLSGGPRFAVLRDAIGGGDAPLDRFGTGSLVVAIPRNPRLSLRTARFQAVLRTSTPPLDGGLEPTSVVALTLFP
jgi:matrixin/IPT/TIG domain-containing protein